MGSKAIADPLVAAILMSLLVAVPSMVNAAGTA
jgi:hypothetical protein